MCGNIDDAKIMYSEYSKVLKQKKDLPPFKKSNGSYTDDTKEKAMMMHEQFTKDLRRIITVMKQKNFIK